MMRLVRHMAARVKSRAADNRGFTLIELLAALVVVVLMTGVIAAGTAVVTRTYGAEQFASQSDVLAGEIENALAAKYRYANAKSLELSVSQGRFVLGGSKELLNAAAYGDCAVSFIDESKASVKPKERGTSGRYEISIDFKVTSNSSGGKVSRDYHLYFALTDDLLNGSAYGDMDGTSGDPGSSSEKDELEAARAELSSLVNTAKSIEKGNKYQSAFDALQQAIAVAEGRNTDDASIEEIKSATQDLKDAISTFRQSATVPDDSGDPGHLVSFTITLTPQSQSYKVGQTGVSAQAVAAYSDGTENRNASWSSSNWNVVSVDGSGNLSFNSKGTATITAWIGGESGTVDITVENGSAQKWVTLPASSYSLGEALYGSQYPMTITIPAGYQTGVVEVRISTDKKLTSAWGDGACTLQGKMVTIKKENMGSTLSCTLCCDTQLAVEKVEIRYSQW